jgi:hypothetical protein
MRTGAPGNFRKSVPNLRPHVKMSKSLGNVIGIKDAAHESWGPQARREGGEITADRIREQRVGVRRIGLSELNSSS